jgi:hypothetical protein
LLKIASSIVSIAQTRSLDAEALTNVSPCRRNLRETT